MAAEVEAEPELLVNMSVVVTVERSQQRTRLKAEAPSNMLSMVVTLPESHAERSALKAEAE